MSADRKLLTEAIGNCWHEWPDLYNDGMLSKHDQCTKCGKYRDEALNELIDFTSWIGFGVLWEWANKQEWWADFIYNYYNVHNYKISLSVTLKIVNPTKFSAAVYEFLKDKK